MLMLSLPRRSHIERPSMFYFKIILRKFQEILDNNFIRHKKRVSIQFFWSNHNCAIMPNLARDKI